MKLCNFFGSKIFVGSRFFYGELSVLVGVKCNFYYFDFLKRLHRILVGSRPEYLVERVKAVYHLTENRVSAGKARNTASFLKGCYKLIGDYLCACFLVCIASQLFFVFFGYLKRSREEESAVRVALLWAVS